MKFWISLGKSRNDTKWKNIQIVWNDLVKKLSEPKVTDETAAEYRKLSKPKQDNIKDVGGYVGGFITGNNRLADNIQCRSLITLDADADCANLWEDYKFVFNNACVIHSTHKSVPNNLRLRLIIPLDREVHTDEYEAIARKIADIVGLDYFDPTTFQPERLMYWPSIPKDVPYYLEVNEGKPMCADDILSLYRNWKDMSEWPIHDTIKNKISRDITKQEDPLTKEGIIGAVCRTYTIQEIIGTYLKDIYEPTDKPDRFTYKHGSTAAGLIVYEDKFAYSHHSTDPCSMMLCNAFDLVRISLYGELDITANERTNVTKLPSYNRACTVFLLDDKIKQNLVGTKVDSAKIEFAEFIKNTSTDALGDQGEPEIDKEWVNSLEVDRAGNCLNTSQNIIIIFEHDEHLRNRFQWDEFNHRLCLTKNTIWKKIRRQTDTWVNDSDHANIRNYLETVYGITNREKIKDGLLIIAMKHSFHPVKQYLCSVKWDGVRRLDSLLIDYLGAGDTNYVREVTRKTLVAAVARIFEPGTKFDNVLMLVGSQGIGKSKLLNILGGEWHSDTVGNLHTKEGMEQLHGVWLVELGELAALKRNEVETVKLFIAKVEDRFRIAFGETISVFPRQCVFIGTTNEDEFLQDQTGNRRFWPVVLKMYRATKSVFDIHEDIRGQIWAEACHYYAMGENLYLESDTKLAAEVEQEKHTEQEGYFEPVETYLNTPICGNWYELGFYDRIAYLNGDKGIGDNTEAMRFKVTAYEIWTEALRGKPDAFQKIQLKAIKNVMKKMPGWEYKAIDMNGQTSKGWYNESRKPYKLPNYQSK